MKILMFLMMSCVAALAQSEGCDISKFPLGSCIASPCTPCIASPCTPVDCTTGKPITSAKVTQPQPDEGIIWAAIIDPNSEPFKPSLIMIDGLKVAGIVIFEDDKAHVVISGTGEELVVKVEDAKSTAERVYGITKDMDKAAPSGSGELSPNSGKGYSTNTNFVWTDMVKENDIATSYLIVNHKYVGSVYLKGKIGSYQKFLVCVETECSEWDNLAMAIEEGERTFIARHK